MNCYYHISFKIDTRLCFAIFRCVYIAPLEALVKERFADWSKKFGDGLGVSVAVLTGESASDVRLLDRSNIIISTPEHWDLLSRR